MREEGGGGGGRDRVIVTPERTRASEAGGSVRRADKYVEESTRECRLRICRRAARRTCKFLRGRGERELRHSSRPRKVDCERESIMTTRRMYMHARERQQQRHSAHSGALWVSLSYSASHFGAPAAGDIYRHCVTLHRRGDFSEQLDI